MRLRECSGRSPSCSFTKVAEVHCGRSSRFVWAGLLLAALAYLLPVAPASAGLYHPKPAACSFGDDGTASSTFLQATRRITFRQATGSLYATKSFGGSEPSGIYGFDASAVCPSGYPLLPDFAPLSVPELNVNRTDIAVDNTTLPSAGNVYLSGGSELLGYDSAGKLLPGFPISSPPLPPGASGSNAWVAVAVNSNGDLWAADAQGIIHEISPSGVALNEIDAREFIPPGDHPGSLGFDLSNDLYIASSGFGVWKLPAPAYDAPAEIDRVAGASLTVDRSTGDLYVAHEKQIDRYRADGALLEQFPASPPAGNFSGIAIDEASKAVYAYEDEPGTRRVDVFKASTLPDLATAPLSDPTETTVTLHGSVHPDGLALSGCEFEWVSEEAFQATGFESLASGGEAECEPPFGSIPTSGTTSISAALSGLTPGETYRYRISASNENGTNDTKGTPPTFALASPTVETVGSPIRSATSARLDSRVDPHGIATEYRFEYLTEAQFQADGESFGAGTETTPSHSAGEGALTELASQQVGELQPTTTYRYRAIADNGAFPPAAGEARSLTTRASDAPLSHGPYPGPPGSDRAWEQVNLPDTAGNPVAGADGVSDSGETVLYSVAGGTPLSESGTFFDYLLARRAPNGSDGHPAQGWLAASVFPPRSLTAYGTWLPPTASSSLSTVLALNKDLEQGSGAAVWRLPSEGGAPAKLYESPRGAYRGPYLFSEDGSRALLALEGEKLDPGHRSPKGALQLYDVSSGTPRMVSLMPGAGEGAVGPACGVAVGAAAGIFGLNSNAVPSTTHWISADGERAFFPSAGEGPSCGTAHLYVRDFATETTTQVDGPLPGGLSGPAGPECAGAMIRSTPEAAYFWTQSRLVQEDSAVSSCGGGSGGDVYRYDLSSHDFECLTCVVAGGRPANVAVAATGTEGAAGSIALAPAGHLLYFTTTTRLLPGAPETGAKALYRVNTETRQLAYLAPLNPGDSVGENPKGSFAQGGSAISPNGRYLAFASAAPALDALSGADNGSTVQDYLYDDAERSLICVSCATGGGAPRGRVALGIIAEEPGQEGPNMTSLSDEGDFAFSTPTSLVSADQNTARAGQAPFRGQDVYEWRDGRPLLVSDGLTDWPQASVAPEVSTISPTGTDLFFTEAAQLTPDALEGYARLYDARIGGGIDFPEASKPCPLEACQGIPKGIPEEAAPASSGFSGAGNEKPVKAHCTKGKIKKRGRCIVKKHKRRGRAKHNRRAAR